MRDISVTLPEAQWIQIMRFLKQDLAAVQSQHSQDYSVERSFREDEMQLLYLITQLELQFNKGGN